ncbi:MAG: CocE/NonD family hydrolase [Anaerolineales bacterium]|nr:CocE/NonD family hydrolase [Anaerolineales bacterium]
MTLPWQDPPVRFREVIAERNVPARMRDGTLLYADIYRPKGDGPWPVLLIRQPYDKTQSENLCYAHPSWYARYGYLVVTQDCRGRWSSEGEWYPFKHEEQDSYDTIVWAAGLPGSNSKVGMYGFSYGGATQLLGAVHQPPGLTTIMPALTGSDYYEGWTYRGGALHHAFTQSWANFLAQDTAHRWQDYQLEGNIAGAFGNAWANYWIPPHFYPFIGQEGLAPYYYDWLRHDTYDDYWKQWTIRSRYEKITVPALHLAGWYDVFLEGTLENFTGLQAQASSEQARQHQKLVVGPWYHMPWRHQVGEVDFGEVGRNSMDALQILWLDKHLRGESNQLDQEPPVALFIMGENKWRFENEWPLKRAKMTRFYLHSDGRANSLNGDGRLDQASPDDELPDVFTYDPRNPVMSIGGHSCCVDTLTPMGAFDQRPQEMRNEVLVYTTEPLAEDVEVVGTVTVTLYAASTAVDTDFTAKLVDVHPYGMAINVGEGILRARFRESLEQPTPIEPDRVYEYHILVGSTANVFKAGHQIRVEISSSNFPAFDRNSNSGKPLVETTPGDWFVATQTVFHDSRYPSHIVLPVVSKQ